MKRLIIALLLPSFCFAQKIPTRANSISISGVTIAQAKAALIKDGYMVVDKDSLTIETLPRQYKEIENGSLIIRASQGLGPIALSCTFNQVSAETVGNPYGNRWRPAVYTSLWGNSKAAFNIMDAFAHSLPGQVTYARL